MACQKVIYDAMDWDVPAMAHIPLIHGPDGAKLSKRHGALGVDAYRAMGYLPEAMRNYLVRLGWAHGDAELLSLDEMTALFDLPGIGRSPARFDFDKLANVNGHYMRAASEDALFATFLDALPHLPGGEAFQQKLTEPRKLQLRAAIAGLKERAKTLVELVDGAGFLVAERPLALDEKAASLLGGAAVKQILRDLAGLFGGLAAWSAASTEEAVRSYAEANGIKLGNVAQPIRAALTGRTVSPPIFDVLAILGRDESLARLRDQAA